MSLEHFKTQVLLLHSEQSTLDNLSAGFNERYTVHCATSGSEALNTLGETQIDVIVSAHDLPGMSGLDALREARKRSPDTIGILLAGNEDDGLEAMVSEKEVFQIVRGGVTSDALRSMIDNATQQARLMALAESANDTTANVDEPTEHIVMETSANGSTIISDGTGTVPILDPAKISEAASVGARSVDLLVLTKDEEFLGTVRESARGLHKVIYANTLAQADDAVRNHKVGVAVIDAGMVGSNVEKITLHLRATQKRLVAIVAGRRDDGEMLMDLINRGKVYRFLLKPVSPGRSRLAIEASVKHHLEAPDSAFALGAKPSTPMPKPVAKPAPTPPSEPKRPNPEQKAAPTPAKPAPTQAQKTTAPTAATAPSKGNKKRKIEPSIGAAAPTEGSPIDAGLGDAFGDDSSFTETMTGIVKSVGDTFSKKKKPKEAAQAPADAPPMSLNSDSGDSGDSLFGNPKLLGAIAAGVIAVGAVAIWLFGGSDESTTPAVVNESPVAAPQAADTVDEPVSLPPSNIDVEDLLNEAELAVAAGQIFNPPGSNAIEYYVEVLAADPGNSVAGAGLESAIDEALSMAETALLARNSGEADAALQRVALASPDNSRLPFLRAQLSQMQLREYLDDSRIAIREGRFEDARDAVNAARALGIADAAEIDVVDSELTAALSDQQLDDVLAKANARLESGQLIQPSNDNARYFYELALGIDSGNTAARQGLTAVAGKLVLQARDAIDAGNFEAAERLIGDARRVDATSPDVSAASTALDAARSRVAAQQRAAQQAEAQRVAAAQAAAQQAEVDRIAAEQAAAEQAEAERLAAQQAEADRLAAEQAEANSPAPAAAGVTFAPSVDDSTAEPQAAAAASAPAAATASPVSVNSLTRTRYVAPKYPRSAQRRNITGWVDVIFTVDIDGTVSQLSVTDSQPGDTFIAAATKAVSGWEFEPVIENGVAVQRRAAVRLMFAIE